MYGSPLAIILSFPCSLHMEIAENSAAVSLPLSSLPLCMDLLYPSYYKLENNFMYTETGHQDEERGVHAIVLVIVLVPMWRFLLRLWPSWQGPLCCYSTWI
ncbi:uncharacterized protein LOC132033988 isoform X4 [Lycium ferocissimum]|uniref:uncharacterized protein LOC132033988 isoform X4 n=1 Tax=Lycium ferocissimum TaxID=112874 RepID=UPI0028163B37|nr:uncharacterized protein LOC132033988 isoform X4 [Lycium ferocissimum]